MQTKVLIIAVIRNDKGEILMRKKPAGSPPYSETWYLFGAELVAGENIEITLQNHLKAQTGINVSVEQKVGWDTEVKADVDGLTKHFVYLDVLCHELGGTLTLTPGIERLEWIAPEHFKDYDIVPPSVKLFKALGLL